MSDSQEQRREHPRVLGPFDGWVLGVMDFHVQLYNLSLGGCFVNSTQGVPLPGKRFRLRIELPDRAAIEVRAEVRFSLEDFGYGARFLDLTGEKRQQLHDALRALDASRKADV